MSDDAPSSERRTRAERNAYALAPGATPPELPGVVVLRPDADSAMDALLEDLVSHALACVREFGDFHLALQASARQEPLFVRMMIDPRFRALPWKRTHLWLVQESSAAGDAFAQVEETIIEHSDIPPEQAHALDLSAKDPARDYEEQIRLSLEWREPGHDRLDAAVLDLSDRVPIREARSGRLVYGAECEGTGRAVIALTPAFLRTSRLISVLAVGAENRPRVSALTGAHPSKAWALTPLAGELRWYVDPESSGM